MDLTPGTPLANAVSAATAAALQGDIHGTDHAYSAAATTSSTLNLAFAEPHCTTLLTLGAPTLAAQRCDEYLTHTPTTNLQILRAQIHSTTTDHTAATHTVRSLRRGRLTELQQARLARIAALSAADRNDFPTAESELDAAERHFRRASHPEELETIGRDRLLLDVRRATKLTKPTGSDPRTPAEFLRQAAALRRDLHYDDALVLMTRCLTSHTIEPTLQFAAIHELTALLVLTRQPGAARKLFPLLVKAAGPAALDHLPDATQSISPEPQLDQIRKLITADYLPEADRLLDNSDNSGATALWHLTTAELAYARGDLSQAAQHFQAATERETHPELKALALRKLGDTYADTGDETRAEACWTRSHRIEQRIAAHHLCEDLELRAIPDKHDNRVRAAVRRVARNGTKALPTLVVALESAHETGDLPRTTDLRAATTLAAQRHPAPPPRPGRVDDAPHPRPAPPRDHRTPRHPLHHRRPHQRTHRSGRPPQNVASGHRPGAPRQSTHRDRRPDLPEPRHHGAPSATPPGSRSYQAIYCQTSHSLACRPANSTSDRHTPCPPCRASPRCRYCAAVPADNAATTPRPSASTHPRQSRSWPRTHRQSSPPAGKRKQRRTVLEAFDRHLARLPRDRALQQALKEVSDHHPADWACWTLHGDAGVQTKAGPLRRRLRKNGGPVPLDVRPKVFLSFAGKDRPHAESLRDELEARNVNAYLDEYEISPGDNIVSAINDALATSDYYVLLWSANTPTRDWVDRRSGPRRSRWR